MKLDVYVKLALFGCTKRDTITIDEEDMVGMNEEERTEFIEEEVKEWAMAHVDWGYDAGT